ncbi:hypothetical protein [Thioalkalivibrio sp. ALE19]|uniref:hypothetical protein n=1 Tax=Thioalkalivibrio sp. ALE19 TaxID=1266909 RepID=UPI00048B2FC4|nr:hypothetical protein [Thioalkalivibrio sp. ALE19]
MAGAENAPGRARVVARLAVPLMLVAVCATPMVAAAEVAADDDTTRFSVTRTLNLDGGDPVAAVGDLSSFSAAAGAGGETRPDPRYRLMLDADAVSRPADDITGVGDRFEATGAFRQRLGSSGLGYGVDLGFGMESRSAPGHLREDAGTTSYFTDFSFGPTFESGGFDSQLRVGVRQPLAGDSRETVAAGGGLQPRDHTRGASYLSLDGSLRLRNDSELSMSLFYDDYSLESSEGWMEDRLEFDGMRPESGGSSSVFGVEMGLTF